MAPWLPNRRVAICEFLDNRHTHRIDSDSLCNNEINSPFAIRRLDVDLATTPLPCCTGFMVTRHEDIESVLLDPATYSAASTALPLVELEPEARRILLDGRDRPQPSMVSLDPPAHARLRRDSSVFDEPDQFELRRPNARRHLTFGKGIHFCVGYALGKLEAELALEALTGALPGLRLVPDQELTFHPNISFRGLQALWVQVEQ